jgi:hypothetical protein
MASEPVGIALFLYLAVNNFELLVAEADLH